MRPLLAARAMAVAFAIFWGYLFYGLIDLMVVFDRTPGFYESYLLETGWGLLYAVMVAAPLVALAFRPGRLSLVAQVAGVGICVAISAVAAFAWRQLLSAACLVLTAAILCALSRTPRRTSGGDESAHPKSAPQWPLLIVACVAIPPSILAAIDLVVGFGNSARRLTMTPGRSIIGRCRQPWRLLYRPSRPWLRSGQRGGGHRSGLRRSARLRGARCHSRTRSMQAVSAASVGGRPSSGR